MAQGTWREDPEENAQLQQEFVEGNNTDLGNLGNISHEEYQSLLGMEPEPQMSGLTPTQEDMDWYNARQSKQQWEAWNQMYKGPVSQGLEALGGAAAGVIEDNQDSFVGSNMMALLEGLGHADHLVGQGYELTPGGGGQHVKTATEIVDTFVSLGGSAALRNAPKAGQAMVRAGADDLARAGRAIEQSGVGQPTIQTIREGVRRLDNAILPTPVLQPAFAGAQDVAVATTARGRVVYNPPPLDPNVLQINAQDAIARGAYLGGRARPGESASARTVFNREVQGKVQPKIRDERAEMATDYSVTDPGYFIDEAGEGADAYMQYHHGGDHKLVGDVGLAIGEERQKKVLKILQKQFSIRTGNDRFNMVLMHGGFDHQGLMHQKYYPQLTTRRMLEEVTASGEIAKWSDKRIAGLMQAAIKDQQEVIIGWGKWKINAIRTEHPITAKMNPKQLKEWVRNNPELVRAAGQGTEPDNVNVMRKFGARKGDERNFNNKWLREVFGIEFMNEQAARGRANEIPAIHRQRRAPGSNKKTTHAW